MYNAKLPPQAVVRACDDYVSHSPAVLSFHKGDFFLLLSQTDDAAQGDAARWLYVSDPARRVRGRVPRALVEILHKTHSESTPISPVKSNHSTASSSNKANTASTPTSSHFSASAKTPPVLSKSPPSNSTSHPTPALMATLLAVVTHDFSSEMEDELDATKGDLLLILAYCNDEWCIGRHIVKVGSPGMIPISYIRFADPKVKLPASSTRANSSHGSTPVIEATLSSATFRAVVREHGIPHISDWKLFNDRIAQSAIKLGSFDTTTPIAKESSHNTNSNSSTRNTIESESEYNHEVSDHSHYNRPSLGDNNNSNHHHTPLSRNSHGRNSGHNNSSSPPITDISPAPARSSSRAHSYTSSSSSVSSNGYGGAFALPPSPHISDTFSGASSASALSILSIAIARYEIKNNSSSIGSSRLSPLPIHEFIIHVTRSDNHHYDDHTQNISESTSHNQVRHILYRTYEDFHTMHVALLSLFPVEAGLSSTRKSTTRIIPYLPAPLSPNKVLTEQITASRRSELERYLIELVSLVNDYQNAEAAHNILTSEPLLAFFAFKAGDRVRSITGNSISTGPGQTTTTPSNHKSLETVPEYSVTSEKTTILTNSGSNNSSHSQHHQSSHSNMSRQQQLAYKSQAPPLVIPLPPSPSSSSSSTLKIKLIYNSEIAALRCNPSSLSLAQLLARGVEKLQLSPTTPTNGTFQKRLPPTMQLWWHSPDSAWIHVDSDEVLQRAAQLAKDGKVIFHVR